MLFKSGPVTTNASGACSAPIRPTGTVLIFAPTNTLESSFLTLAAYTNELSALLSLPTKITSISDLYAVA